MLNGKKEVADLGITFDDTGLPIRIKKPDPQFFANVSNAKKIIEPNINEELTEVVKSDIVEIIKQIRATRRQQYPDEFGATGSLSDIDLDNESQLINLDIES